MSLVPFNEERCKIRLLEEYKLHNNLIIAFDFDNTIFDYHNLGDDYSGIIELLRRCQSLHMILILFTTEINKEKLQTKVNYLHSVGIFPDYVNESPIYKGSQKPYYNLLLDDRAGLESAIRQLEYVLSNI